MAAELLYRASYHVRGWCRQRTCIHVPSMLQPVLTVSQPWCVQSLVVPLVHMLSEAEFDIKKEAAWAISNATSGGRAEQIHTLVQAGAIKPLCDLLTCSDPRIITVALEGIENILKASPSP